MANIKTSIGIPTPGSSFFNAGEATVNVYQVIRGKDIPPIAVQGVKKIPTITALPPITGSLLTIDLPDGFGVAQNVYDSSLELFANPISGCPVNHDIICGQLIVLNETTNSGNISFSIPILVR